MHTPTKRLGSKPPFPLATGGFGGSWRGWQTGKLGLLLISSQGSDVAPTIATSSSVGQVRAKGPSFVHCVCACVYTYVYGRCVYLLSCSVCSLFREALVRRTSIVTLPKACASLATGYNMLDHARIPCVFPKGTAPVIGLSFRSRRAI